MLKELISSATGSENRSPRGFAFLVALLCIPSATIWFFYRSLFQADASIAGLLALSAITAWLWAYLISYGDDKHTAEIID